ENRLLVRVYLGYRRRRCHAHTTLIVVWLFESWTFICSERERYAGPTNKWREPGAMRETLRGLFDGAMRGSTMYVIPFSMGPVDSPLAQLGVQVTDSPYVAVSLHLMTRVGTQVLEALAPGGPFVPAVHSVGAPLVTGEGANEVRVEDVPWPCNAT